jgi:hypothetical protein
MSIGQSTSGWTESSDVDIWPGREREMAREEMFNSLECGMQCKTAEIIGSLD